MSKAIVIATPAAIELELQTEPISPDWVLSGTPVSRSKNLARSRDWTSNIVVWECNSGQFNWHYSKDEVIVVVSGEAFMINESGQEKRIGPGDLGFFPAGTSCTWRVPVGIRKVAVLRETMWRPLGLALKVWNKLLRTAGLTGKSPL
jgi:uncharacterized cupin superfamily protein